MRISQLALAVALLTAPLVTLASTVALPTGAVGLTEASYQQLKSEQCYSFNAPSNAIPAPDAFGGGLCDPLLARLVGQIVFRAEHHGEMYQVSQDKQTGSALLAPYLPDGFYEAGGKFYWVVNNSGVYLKSGDEYRRILVEALVDKDATMITFVRNTQITQAQHDALQGRIVEDVDNHNALEYVPSSSYGTELWPISPTGNEHWSDVMARFGNEIIHVKPKVIRKLPFNIRDFS